MNGDWRRWLFYVAAAYDGLLGSVFVLFWRWPFQLFGVTPPNHGGYVQFPSLLLLVFGLMFLRIARDPQANRDLIVYGIGLKLSYSGLVFAHQLTGGVPTMWLPWAWIDLAFLVLFVMAYRSLAPRPAVPAHR